MSEGVDLGEAERHLHIIAEGEEVFCFRVFDDDKARADAAKATNGGRDPRADKFTGTLSEAAPRLIAANEDGCGVYVVVNEGGQTKAEIKRVRAVFADSDRAGADLSPILGCGLDPHLVVESSRGKWHAYWIVDDLPLEKFEGVQLSIAAEFDTDASVHDLPRVMRLAGFYHRKAEPFLVRIYHEGGGIPYAGERVLSRFRPVASSASQPAKTTADGLISEGDRHRVMLKVGGSMRRLGVCETAIEQSLQALNVSAFTEAKPVSEVGNLVRWLSQKPANDPGAPRGLAESIRALLTPVSDDEFTAAEAMHPHAFERGEMGAFPHGELTIVGAPGREGKTTILVGIVARYALGAEVAGMRPQTPRRAVILSAEDDRAQYVRKLGAQLDGLSRADRAKIVERVILPDFNDPAVRDYRQLVGMIERHPKKTPTVSALIDALRPMTTDPVPLGLIVIETASTWNDAPEDNPGQRAIVEACKDIAQALGVAVILVHHTSQAASNNLPTLDISANDIRGGTALTFNSRQNWLLVNLGSEDDPLPERDARTTLRRAIAPGNPHRIASLICLDSSKSEDPPPVFLQWERSAKHGPRAVEIQIPAEFAGKRWKKVRAQLIAERVEARQEAKEAARDANVRTCLQAVAKLTEEGKQATVRAVSTLTGHGAAWAEPYLSLAITDGSLTRKGEPVPRVKGLVDVYRPADLSEADK